MFEVAEAGEEFLIIEHDAEVGKVIIASGHKGFGAPDALARARYLVDAANRDEERLVQQGVEVVQCLLRGLHKTGCPTCQGYPHHFITVNADGGEDPEFVCMHCPARAIQLLWVDAPLCGRSAFVGIMEWEDPAGHVHRFDPEDALKANDIVQGILTERRLEQKSR